VAIYHCSVKPVQRSKGRSAVAAGAYRAAEKIADQRTGLTHDYTMKMGVAHSEVFGFDGTRDELWNAAELAERKSNACTAREYEVALPEELSLDQQIELAQEYSQWINERHDCAVDLNIHDIEGNPHAHILTTVRAVENGCELGPKIAREWSDTKRKANGLEGRKADLLEAREQWGTLCNEALLKAECDQVVDHRSLVDQGFEHLPTIHMGPDATAMEKRGAPTERGEINRQVERVNGLIHELSARQVVSLDAVKDLQAQKLEFSPEGLKDLERQLVVMERRNDQRGAVQRELNAPREYEHQLETRHLRELTRETGSALHLAEKQAQQAEREYNQAAASYERQGFFKKLMPTQVNSRLTSAADRLDDAEEKLKALKKAHAADLQDKRQEASHLASREYEAETERLSGLESKLEHLPQNQDVESLKQQIYDHPSQNHEPENELELEYPAPRM